MFLKLASIAVFLISINSKADIFQSNTTNINPSMRHITSLSYKNKVLRYGKAKENSLHCAKNTLNQFVCSRIHDGITLNEEVVFAKYMEWADDLSDGSPSIDVMEDGSAVAVQPREDRNGLVFALQKKLPNGQFGPWVLSTNVLNTEYLYHVEVAILSRPESLRILTQRKLQTDPKNFEFYPVLRRIELIPGNNTMAAVVQETQNINNGAAPSFPFHQQVSKILKDTIRNKTFFIQPHNFGANVLICPHDGNCSFGNNLHIWNKIQAAETNCKIEADIDVISGSFYVLTSIHTTADNKVSSLTTFTVNSNNNISYNRRQYFLDDLDSPIKIKALGENSLAFAYLDYNSETLLKWRIFHSTFGWSQPLSFISIDPPFYSSSKEKIKSERWSDFIDFKKLKNNDILISGWGFDDTEDKFSLKAQTYSPSEQKVKPIETILLINQDYSPVFSFLTDEGLNTSYGYFPTVKSPNEPINPQSQQIIIKKLFY